MLDISPFTDAQWWAMCSFDMSLPQQLAEADLTKPFVYQRGLGVFHVPAGRHQAAMSLLLAFQNGLTSGIDVARRLGLDFSDGTADHWLEHTVGAAFRSSVGASVQAGRPGSLSSSERRYFGDVQYLFGEPMLTSRGNQR